MSRVPPKIEQPSAIKAKVFHVLPVEEDGITYTVSVVYAEKPKTSEHFLTATDAGKNIIWKTSVYYYKYNEALETDVQDIFVVDLYIEGNEVAVKLEYCGILRFEKTTGHKI
ncbi:MAG: hypothetical protein JST37_03400 [Bacteroidetes bacterium]|nr:hypothetical protein [Bacteroidota bacterium]MBS1981496.1 hypothetical protein [Bacteroidota bacterium]